MRACPLPLDVRVDALHVSQRGHGRRRWSPYPGTLARAPLKLPAAAAALAHSPWRRHPPLFHLASPPEPVSRLRALAASSPDPATTSSASRDWRHQPPPSPLLQAASPPSSALIPLRRAGAQPRNAVSAAPWPTDAPATPTSWSFAKRRGCDTNLALTTRVAPSPRARHPRAHPRRASASTSSHHDDAVVRNVGRDPATPR